jgi:hypothetical protein
MLRYLSKTRLYRIIYSNVLGHPNPFFGYANIAFTNSDEQKLTIRYVFIMASSVITWHSKKQLITALSFIEAEYIALSKVAHKAWWLRSLFKELKFGQTLLTMILGDNEGLITITKNPQFYKQVKHTNLQYHSIREQVREGEIIVESCRSHSQTTDMLTKPLLWIKYK